MQMRHQLLCRLCVAFILALPILVTAQTTKNTFDIYSDKVIVKVNDLKSENFLFEMTGPDNYQFTKVVKTIEAIEINNGEAKGERFKDGLYQVQITPYYIISADLRPAYEDVRSTGDPVKMEAFKRSLNITQSNYAFTKAISVKNGSFVYPKVREDLLEIPGVSDTWIDSYMNQTASLHGLEMAANLNLTLDRSPSFFDQVFIDDVIVDGSICVGQDCVNGESFGFDTGRYKENNLRVHFDDTSSSASFPSNDWRITINDSSNGGASYFAVEDATGGTVPFRVMAGSGNNALYVSQSGGNVGMGTASPVLELHITDGDSPSMRLEQNGANGWTPQTWDVAGNETNFFVRDVTNGSKIPFKIRPGAPDNSLYVQTNGRIGLGTASPSENLHLKTGNALIESGNLTLQNGNIGINTVPTVSLDVIGNAKVTGALTVNGSFAGSLTGISTFLSPSFQSILTLDAVNSRVGIGTFAPAYLLELGTDSAAKPGGGMWTAASDRRLKTNINGFKDGLNVIMKINPVTYNYNGKLNYPTEDSFVGIIAQEVQEVAPYMVKPLAGDHEEDYLAFDGAPLTFILVNAIQEQQKMINSQKETIAELKSQVDEIAELKAMVSALSGQVEAITNSNEKVAKTTEE